MVARLERAHYNEEDKRAAAVRRGRQSGGESWVNMKLFKDEEYAKKTKYAIVAGFACIFLVFFLLNLSGVGVALGGLLGILTPFIVALVTAYILSRLQTLVEGVLLRRIRSDKLRRGLGLTIIYLLVALSIIGLIWLVVPSLINSLMMLAVNLPIYMQNMVTQLSQIAFLNTEVGAQILGAITTLVKGMFDWFSSLSEIAPSVVSTATSIAGSIFGVALGIVLSVCLLAGKEKLLCQCKRLIYAVFKTQRADHIVEELQVVNRIFAGFLVGKLLECILLTAVYLVIFSILGLPYGALFAVVISVFNIVPMFGCIVGAIISGLILLVVSPSSVLVFVIVVLVIQVVEGNFIAPRILGNATGLSFWWVMFAIMVGGGLFGIWGFLLGTPVFATLYYFLRKFTQRRLQQKHLDIQPCDRPGSKYTPKRKFFRQRRAKQANQTGDAPTAPEDKASP